MMVTHDPTVAHRCQRIISLHDGEMVKDIRDPGPIEAAEGGQMVG